MERKKRLLLVSPNLDTRTRLREALRTVAFDATVEGTRSASEGSSRLENSQDFDVLFLSLTGLSEDFVTLIDQARTKHTPAPRIVIVLPNPQVDATFVAELFARGVDGFIAEPFSTSELEELFVVLNNPPAEDSAVARDMRMLGFLASRLQLKIDEVADIQAQRDVVSATLPRSFTPLRETLSRLHESNPEAFTKVLLSKYENVPAPRAGKKKVNRKAQKDTRHPGMLVQERIAERRIEMERIMTLLGLSAADLEALLRGQRGVDEQLANGLARALGETPRFWVEMQKQYDRVHTKAQ